MGNNKYIHSSDIHNTRAAEEIIPVLMEWFHPETVVDVGCGLGTWLHVFKSHGVKEILGIDGHHLNTDKLVISRDDVILMDLEEGFELPRKFDLALSLEAAEHLSAASADRFVASLAKLSDVIIFSAAIPDQGGQNHVNEQWIGYWQSRFAHHGFVFTDEIRPLFWNNDNIEWWYRQNMLVAIQQGAPSPFKEIRPPLDLVHPGLYEMKNGTIRKLSKANHAARRSMDDLRGRLEMCESDNTRLKMKLAETESELKAVHHSISRRFISRFVLKPIDRLRNLL